jgi:hypothetical protein
MDEGMQIKGSLTLVLAKLSGEVEVVHKDNIIVNGGFDFVADAIGNSGSRPGVMGWIAVGTGTTAAASTQTACLNLRPHGRNQGVHLHGQLCSRRRHRCIDRSGCVQRSIGRHYV